MSKYPTRYQATLPIIPAEGDKGTQHVGANIVRVVLTQPGNQEGFKIDDVRKRVTILNRIDEDPAALLLNEDERTLLLDTFKNFRFGVADKNIVSTYDAIVNAEDVTVRAV